MDIYSEIHKKLVDLTDQEISGKSRFFKTAPGEYGAHDKFLGVSNPILRKIAKTYKDIDLLNLEKLIQSEFNEERLLSLFIMDLQYKKNDEKIFDLYIKNIQHINNWNLVDASAHLIIGRYLYNKKSDMSLLKKLAYSNSLWDRRIAIIATFYFIRNNELDLTIEIAKILLKDDEQLIHKAVGWMLREVGVKNILLLEEFLKLYCKEMPRTMLRYSLEKISKEHRKKYMKNNS